MSTTTNTDTFATAAKDGAVVADLIDFVNYFAASDGGTVEAGLEKAQSLASRMGVRVRFEDAWAAIVAEHAATTFHINISDNWRG
jgi:hypothetical protein